MLNPERAEIIIHPQHHMIKKLLVSFDDGYHELFNGHNDNLLDEAATILPNLQIPFAEVVNMQLNTLTLSVPQLLSSPVVPHKSYITHKQVYSDNNSLANNDNLFTQLEQIFLEGDHKKRSEAKSWFTAPELAYESSCKENSFTKMLVAKALNTNTDDIIEYINNLDSPHSTPVKAKLVFGALLTLADLQLYYKSNTAIALTDSIKAIFTHFSPDDLYITEQACFFKSASLFKLWQNQNVDYSAQKKSLFSAIDEIGYGTDAPFIDAVANFLESDTRTEHQAKKDLLAKILEVVESTGEYPKQVARLQAVALKLSVESQSKSIENDQVLLPKLAF